MHIVDFYTPFVSTPAFENVMGYMMGFNLLGYGCCCSVKNALPNEVSRT
jgi:hypothetical protein